MEVESAFRRLLLSTPAVTGYVGSKVYRHRLETNIEGTGGLACVVARQPGWKTPDPVQTFEYPVLWIDCHADPTRDSAGNIAALDGEDKALALARVVTVLMRPEELRGSFIGAYGSNPGLYVASIARGGETRLLHDHDMPPDQRLGDTVVARTTWDIGCAPG